MAASAITLSVGISEVRSGPIRAWFEGRPMIYPSLVAFGRIHSLCTVLVLVCAINSVVGEISMIEVITSDQHAVLGE